MRAAEWVLYQRAGLLKHAHLLITEQVIRPPQPQRPFFSDPDPGPVLYDTGLSPDEGLWLRQGWAGRA